MKIASAFSFVTAMWTRIACDFFKGTTFPLLLSTAFPSLLLTTIPQYGANQSEVSKYLNCNQYAGLKIIVG